MSEPCEPDQSLLTLILALLDDYDTLPVNQVLGCVSRALDDLEDPAQPPAPAVVVERARELLDVERTLERLFCAEVPVRW